MIFQNFTLEHHGILVANIMRIKGPDDEHAMSKPFLLSKNLNHIAKQAPCPFL